MIEQVPLFGVNHVNMVCVSYRLRASRVLIVGMKGLGAEIAKNLILAGVKGLTMLDHEQVCIPPASLPLLALSPLRMQCWECCSSYPGSAALWAGD